MPLPRKKREESKEGRFGPGMIYELFYRKSEGEEKEEKVRDYEKFIEMCRDAHKKSPYKGEVSKDLRDALDFLGWDLQPEAIVSAARLYAMYALVAGIVLVPFLLYMMDYIGIPPSIDDLVYASEEIFFWVILALPLILGAITYYSVLSYPVSLAKSVFQKDLLPSLRVVGNIVLSMKLVPNLEKAISFAVEHGEGFLAETLKQVLWDAQLGMYASVEEGLDRVAYRIGRYSDEFKHAIMRIRTSLLEADDAKRYVLLDSALNEAVEGVKNRMVAAASALYAPAIQLFYLGVFLPLLLFIIVPVWAVFSPDTPVANPVVLVLLYNVFLPSITFYFAKSILAKRPQAYTAPEIPDRLVKGYQKKKRRAIVQTVAILLIGLGASYYLHTLLDMTPGKVLSQMGICPEGDAYCVGSIPEEQLQYYLSGYDLTPYALIFGSLLSIVLALAYYLYTITKEKLKIQEDIMTIEKEFKDAVYVLASRMGEGKPLENALDAVAENMPEAKISPVFQRISYNVKSLGLTIEDAIFSPVFGVLNDIPSKMLHDAMRLVVSAVSLGTELASRALAALSEQLRNEEIVVQRIREKTGEIAAMMYTMAYFVGPIVLGITVALEKVIVSSVTSMDIGVSGDMEGIPSEFRTTADLFSRAGSASPIPDWLFLLSVAVYTLEITALLVWFASYLHDGPNRIRMYRKLAYALIVSLVLFIASAWFSISLVQGMM